MKISWCSTGLVIDVNFVALIKNVSLPFQTAIESMSCLVGLVGFFSIHLAQRNFSLFELCLSADAQGPFPEMLLELESLQSSLSWSLWG